MCYLRGLTKFSGEFGAQEGWHKKGGENTACREAEWENQREMKKKSRVGRVMGEMCEKRQGFGNIKKRWSKMILKTPVKGGGILAATART